MTLISIIVTCFNQEHTIEATVESVLAQTHRDLECLVIDDGSTDGSREVIERLARKDCRVQYRSQANQGVSVARNHGFSSSSGEFIQFLDGDDRLAPEKLERQLVHFSDHPTTDVSYTNHDYLDLATGRKNTYPFQPLAERPLEQMLRSWFDGYHLPVHAPLFRRRIWEPNELPYPSDYRDRCEDWVFLVLLAMKNVTFRYLDQVLCTYCVSGGNFTSASKDWNTAAIVAGAYLEHRIPQQFQDGFLKDVAGRSLDRYHNSRKADVLHASWNWQIGNLLSRPFCWMLRRARYITRYALESIK